MNDTGRQPTLAHLLATAYAALKQAGSRSAETVKRELLELKEITYAPCSARRPGTGGR